MPGGDGVAERDHRAAVAARAAPIRSRAIGWAARWGATPSSRARSNTSASVCAIRSTLRRRPLRVVDAARQLLADVDHAARVDREVRRVDHARGCFSSSPIPASASWLLAAPAMILQRSAPIVSPSDRRAQRARREHVALDGWILHRGGPDAPSASRGSQPVGVMSATVTVARPPAGGGRHAADVAQTLHGDVDAVESRPSPASRSEARIPQKTPQAVIGDGSPEPPLATGSPVMWACASHLLGVVGRRADVLSGQVAAAEPVDESAQREELLRPLVGAGIAQHDGLAAAQIEPGQRVLVGHALRQAQHVDERRLVGRVRPHADAAQPGPSVVSWTATMARSPLSRSVQTAICSCSPKSRTTGEYSQRPCCGSARGWSAGVRR